MDMCLSDNSIEVLNNKHSLGKRNFSADMTLTQNKNSFYTQKSKLLSKEEKFTDTSNPFDKAIDKTDTFTPFRSSKSALEEMSLTSTNSEKYTNENIQVQECENETITNLKIEVASLKSKVEIMEKLLFQQIKEDNFKENQLNNSKPNGTLLHKMKNKYNNFTYKNNILKCKLKHPKLNCPKPLLKSINKKDEKDPKIALNQVPASIMEEYQQILNLIFNIDNKLKTYSSKYKCEREKKRLSAFKTLDSVLSFLMIKSSRTIKKRTSSQEIYDKIAENCECRLGTDDEY